MISTTNRKFWLKMWSLKDHGKNYESLFNKKHKRKDLSGYMII